MNRRTYQTECMSFLNEVDEFLEKYNKAWYKISNIIKKSSIVNLWSVKNI